MEGSFGGQFWKAVLEGSFRGQFWRAVLEDSLEQARELGYIAISHFNTPIASKHGVYPQNP